MSKSFRSHLHSVVAVFSASPRRFASTVMVGLLVVAAVAGPVTPARADGETWTARDAAEANYWWSVAYGDGLWVAVALWVDKGENQVMTSTDGIIWMPRTAPVALWRSVAYGVVAATGKGLWVAVADGGGTNAVMTSTDGITWTPQTAAQPAGWMSVAYGDGLWVAVGDSGDDRVMTSPDGINWTAETAAHPNGWYSVAYGVVAATGKGLWVAVAYSGTNRVMTSLDGEIWNARDAAANFSWRSVAYGGGLWVAVAQDGTKQVMTSLDGEDWKARDAAEDNSWMSVAYGDGLWVAVAVSGDDRVMTSTDPACTPVDPEASCWTARAAAENNGWYSVAYGDGLWVAVADSGANRVMTSGATFVQAQTAALSPPSVSCAPSPLVAGASVTCTVTGGDPGIDILWQAAYNPVFAGAGVALGADGVGTFTFTVPVAALGQEVTVELVEWLAPVSIGVVGGPVPTLVPSGGGPVPVWSLVLLALAGGLVLRRKSAVGVHG